MYRIFVLKIKNKNKNTNKKIKHKMCVTILAATVCMHKTAAKTKSIIFLQFKNQKTKKIYYK